MIEGRPVTLSEMMAARDWRAARQRAFEGRAIACLTLNIAGPVKRFPLSDRAFSEGKRLVALLLGEAGQFREERVDETGHWALFTVDMDPAACKRLMVGIEQGHPIGWLFDIDVAGPDGAKLSRDDPRRCLICGEPAHACARSRSHPLEALQRATASRLQRHFDATFADAVQQAATRALLCELSATPKPGLVDRSNSGSHRDMDFASFLDSTAAIAKSFRTFAQRGMKEADDRALFAQLRALGIRAEADMLAATRGANTHRGAIFALGLLAAGCGRLHARGEGITADAVCQEAAKLGAIAHAELASKPAERLKSHGERAYAEHGAGGARAEAMAGYPSVRDVALPTIRAWLARGASANDASVCAMLALIARVEDTNLIARAGRDAADAVRAAVRRRLEAAGADLQAQLNLAARLDAAFIRDNLSPGGCADLLAAAWMLHFLEGAA